MCFTYLARASIFVLTVLLILYHGSTDYLIFSMAKNVRGPDHWFLKALLITLEFLKNLVPSAIIRVFTKNRKDERAFIIFEILITVIVPIVEKFRRLTKTDDWETVKIVLFWIIKVLFVIVTVFFAPDVFEPFWNALFEVDPSIKQATWPGKIPFIRAGFNYLQKHYPDVLITTYDAVGIVFVSGGIAAILGNHIFGFQIIKPEEPSKKEDYYSLGISLMIVILLIICFKIAENVKRKVLTLMFPVFLLATPKTAGTVNMASILKKQIFNQVRKNHREERPLLDQIVVTIV